MSAADDRCQFASQEKGLLGDSAARNYSDKLALFNAFAEPELRAVVGDLSLQPGMFVLDAGCGIGAALEWFGEAVGPSGLAVGFDLASAHVAAARARGSKQSTVLQADLLKPPFVAASFDVVWCMNTINHLRARVAGIQMLTSLLRPGGRVVLAQSSFLPDMYFAWDARLERQVSEAVFRYYRDRYNVSEQELASVRALTGLLREAGLEDVRPRT